MRSVRVLTVAAAAAALLAGCAGEATVGRGQPADRLAATAPGSPTARPAGNGVAALPPDQIVSRARLALSKAATVRIRADVRSAGQPVRMDLRIVGSRGAIGTMTVDGQTFQLLRIGKAAYIKATEAVWRKLGAGAGASLLVGKWVKVSTKDKDFADVITFTDIAAFSKEVFDQGLVGTPASSRVTLRGLDAVKLADPDGNSLYVAAGTGQPYPLRLQSLAPKSDSGTIDFLDFNRPVQLSLPPAGQVVDTTTGR